MEQFSLDEFLKNPTRPIVTRDGRRVRIICTDGRNNKYPIIALMQSEEGKEANNYTIDGMYIDGHKTCLDLFIAPEKKEGWVNLYRAEDEDLPVLGHLYDTEEEARENKSSAFVYMTTVKIEWEE